ncbi:MAG: cation diffusion facilitator family transporter [Pseudonocardiaceae bacterium]
MGTTSTLRTVSYALATNLVIAALKATAGALTGSAAMLAESAHSVVDSSTELILLGGEWHSRRWSKARHFWALVAAVDMFAVGGVYAVWQGLDAMLSPAAADGLLWVGLVVLAVSAALEAGSWLRALRTLAATRNGTPWLRHIATTTNSSAKAVLYEDSADLAGVALAAAGIGMRLLTGSAVWDGLASVLIGLLLAAMSYELGASNLRLLASVDQTMPADALPAA